MPLGIFQSSSLDFYTPWCHSITKDHQGILPQSHTPPDLASQDMGPVLTMLALLVYPLHLHVNLGRKTIFHDDLATLDLRVSTKISLYINQQNKSPKNKIKLHYITEF